MSIFKTCPCCQETLYQSDKYCLYCRFNFAKGKAFDYKLRNPYPYFGSKRKVASDVWQLFTHQTEGSKKGIRYIEPFLGSAAMLLTRPIHLPIHCIANDKNRFISNFWRAVQFCPDQVVYWADWPVNEVDLNSRHIWLESQADIKALENGSPGDQELLERINNLEATLRADPMECDPKIAGWWVYGMSAWIGGTWCNKSSTIKKMPKVPNGGTNGLCRNTQVPLVEDDTIHRRRMPSTPCGQGVDGDKAMSESIQQPHGHKPRINNQNMNATGKRPDQNFDGYLTERKTENLLAWFRELQDALRSVIVCCGDWERVLTPAVRGSESTVAVFLDPPYKGVGAQCYSRYHDDFLSGRVRNWCIRNGDNPKLRIALCGFDTEHNMPASWSIYRWEHARGMNKGDANMGRERIWFSPHCPALDGLYELKKC